jgi:diamine N-acetyltransferase
MAAAAPREVTVTNSTPETPEPRTTPAGAAEPQLVISGDRVGLGPLRADLVPTYQRWINDREVADGIGRYAVTTEEAEREWYEQASRARDGQTVFTIYDLGDLAPVGTASLFAVDHRSGRATFGILLGERRGQGLGTEATRLVLEWAFTVLGLYNVELQAWEWNRAAIRAYAKAGFREVGRRRGATVFMGRRYDAVIMDAIAPEFEGKALSAAIPEGGTPVR